MSCDLPTINFDNNQDVIMLFYKFLRKLPCNSFDHQHAEDALNNTDALIFNLTVLQQIAFKKPTYEVAMAHLQLLIADPESLIEIIRNYSIGFQDSYCTKTINEIIEKWRHHSSPNDSFFTFFDACLHLCISIINKTSFYSNNEKKEMIQRINCVLEMTLTTTNDLVKNMTKIAIEGLVYTLVPMMLYKTKNIAFFQSYCSDTLLRALQNITTLKTVLQNKNSVTGYSDFQSRWSIYCLERSSSTLVRDQKVVLQRNLNLQKLLNCFICSHIKKAKPAINHKEALFDIQTYLDSHSMKNATNGKQDFPVGNATGEDSVVLFNETFSMLVKEITNSSDKSVTKINASNIEVTSSGFDNICNGIIEKKVELKKLNYAEKTVKNDAHTGNNIKKCFIEETTSGDNPAGNSDLLSSIDGVDVAFDRHNNELSESTPNHPFYKNHKHKMIHGSTTSYASYDSKKPHSRFGPASLNNPPKCNSKTGVEQSRFSSKKAACTQSPSTENKTNSVQMPLSENDKTITSKELANDPDQNWAPIVHHPFYIGPICSGYEWWKSKQDSITYEEQQKHIGDLHMIIDTLKYENGCLKQSMNYYL